MAERRNNAQNSIEDKVKSRIRRERIQDIVLWSLFLAMTIGVMMAAPNSMRLVGYLGKHLGKRNTKLDRRINQALTRLKQKGLINKDAKGTIHLTKNGKRRAAMIYIPDLMVRPLRWDRKWRIVIFDIWERRRATRNQLRIILERNGFVRIQNSVWVYPYPCEELFAFLRAHLSLGRGILYIVADEIENDSKLRKHFNLPVA